MLVTVKKNKSTSEMARLERRSPGALLFQYAQSSGSDEARKGGGRMKTESMQARFIGDEQDPGTQAMGLVRHGVYMVRLSHPTFIERLFGNRWIRASIRISGVWTETIYESINAFDRNWEIKTRS